MTSHEGLRVVIIGSWRIQLTTALIFFAMKNTKVTVEVKI